ncbi:MAG: PhoB family transcriptional regulator [Paenibacillaceae bacterium]|nr:PhoB family transcriptional regulator [Paenibacillaceae bacterium]
MPEPNPEYKTEQSQQQSTQQQQLESSPDHHPERILIVEDETRIARILSIELSHEGYVVDTADNGRDGLDKATNGEWDLILLDIMLPELNGIEVLRRIKAAALATPVIFISARDTTPDIVSGLDLGASDYITKPFEIEEVLARIRVCLRDYAAKNQTAEPADSDELRLATLSLSTKSREVSRDERSIDLTPKEFDLLVYLLQHPGEVLTREQIMQHVWGYDFVGDTNTVDVYIRYLRRKIDYGFKPQLIQTVRGVGYCIKDPAK